MRSARRRLALHVVLLLITLFTTAAAGAAFSASFEGNRPLSFDDFFPVYSDWRRLADGLPYALTLLLILFAHEMGHYLTCRYYGINASLPYFIGAPTLIGTFGAFIRIRSAITSRRQLFDVGIAGPLAGFAFVLPALAIGLAYSRIIPGIAQAGDFSFSTPLLLRGMEALIFPGVPHTDIQLHPVARAAWFGVLATALNLMPIGQLDGGHILYSLVGRWHKPLTWLFIVALIPLGFFYSWVWLLWAALLAMLARRHPRIYDPTPPGRIRRWLGLLAAIIFVASFSVTPVHI
ncbi:MAG TPA: site-2 protease family protein [Bryobacteraceae bacterium]|nr:site-2 protease family protein [Bryobacteraceae bacterium]